MLVAFENVFLYAILHYLVMVYNRNLKRFTTLIYKFDLNDFHHLYLHYADYFASSANFYGW